MINIITFFLIYYIRVIRTIRVIRGKFFFIHLFPTAGGGVKLESGKNDKSGLRPYVFSLVERLINHAGIERLCFPREA
jgi:hypothetical protein